MARAFRSPRCRPDRRCCKRSLPKSTVPNLDGQIRVAGQIKSIFLDTPGVVDTDWYVEDPQPRLAIRVDQVKAAQHGIAVSDVAHALALATSGTQVGLLHDPTAREPIPLVVETRPRRPLF